MEKKLTLGADKKLLGVCSGFAEFFGLDPTLIRVVWALSFFCLGFGGLAYLVCWLVIPKRSQF